MDKLSSLNLDFDRVLIQLIIPGLTAVFPWAILFFNHHHVERDLLCNNMPIMVTIITILSLISGIILENFGGLIEVCFYDKKNSKTDPNYLEIWDKFLLLNYAGHQPIGHRYLRNILLRMKFELSFGLAIIPMAVGLVILDNQYIIFESNWWKFFLFYIIPLLTFFYLIFKEAYLSSKVLAKTRKILVEKYFVI